MYNFFCISKGIPEEIKENKEVVTDTIDIIDKVFAKIMEWAKNKNVKLEFDKGDYLNDFNEAVKPKDGEIIVSKNYTNAFLKTNL